MHERIIIVAMFCVVGMLGAVAGWPSEASAQVANFHPCNADPSLPVCRHGYGRRIAVKRWGAQPEPLDPDAAANASLVTRNAQAEIKKLKSSTVLVEDIDSAEILFARNENTVRPIASITKLMTALVLVDANLPMEEMISIRAGDHSASSDLPSRLPVGASVSRLELLHLALTSSENSAAHALGRTYPGGMSTFVEAMNAKAQALGMTDSAFVEPTGLSNDNVSSARDLVKLVAAASRRPLIRLFSTTEEYEFSDQSFRNTNRLVGRPNWTIRVSKTGTTREAGDCLVMLVRLAGRDLAIVLLDAQGMNGSRFGDAVRVRRIVNSQMALDVADVSK